MKSIFDLVNDDGEILGPGTDLIISLVAVLVMLLALHSTSSKRKISELENTVETLTSTNEYTNEQLYEYEKQIKWLKGLLESTRTALENQDIILKQIKQSQLEIINEIAINYGISPITSDSNQFKIPILLSYGFIDTIRIQNDATLQRISFGNAILFDDNQAFIKSKGKEVLINICSVFKKKLNLIKEIQIQGHASADSWSLYYSYPSYIERNDNLDLASRRAIAIVRFFRDHRKLEISPAEHVIYASSLGYYMPVERDYSDSNWNLGRIAYVNQWNNGDKNKRIEIVLNYKELKSQ